MFRRLSLLETAGSRATLVCPGAARRRRATSGALIRRSALALAALSVCLAAFTGVAFGWSDVCAIDANEGWTTGAEAGQLAHTTDGGTRWEGVRVADPAQGVWLAKVRFADRLHGWCVGTKAQWTPTQWTDVYVYRTSDGGKTWAGQKLYGGVAAFTYVLFASDASHAWIAGYRDDVTLGNRFEVWYNTSNGGASWTKSSESKGGTAAQEGAFVGQYGWSVGSRGWVIKSADWGASWAQVPLGTVELLQDVSFVDQNRGWIAANGGNVYRTLDAGKSWSVTATGLRLIRIAFRDAANGCVGTWDGDVYRTTDGGAHWSLALQHTSSDWPAYGLALRGTSGWLNKGGAMFRSRDGGATWSQVTPFPSSTVPKASFVRYTNPVAYELRSLQKTQFSAAVDLPGTAANLRIKTPAGDKVLFNGTIPTAGTTFWFPSWTGMGVDGKRLPSAVYDWVLTLSKNGYTSTYTGKISVSRIYFAFSGTSTGGAAARHTGYMVPGNANVYISADALTQSADSLGASLRDPYTYRRNLGSWTVPVQPGHLSTTAYLRYPNQPRTRSVHTFDMTGRTKVGYRVTVIQ